MTHEPGHCCGCERIVDEQARDFVASSSEAEALGAVAAGPWHRLCLAVVLTGRRWVEKRRTS